ncbi:MAG: hypothetical protein ACOCV1_07400 [Bacillota bacterium]
MTKTKKQPKYVDCEHKIGEIFYEKDEQGMFFDVEINHCGSDEPCKYELTGICQEREISEAEKEKYNKINDSSSAKIRVIN